MGKGNLRVSYIGRYEIVSKVRFRYMSTSKGVKTPNSDAIKAPGLIMGICPYYSLGIRWCSTPNRCKTCTVRRLAQREEENIESVYLGRKA